MVVETLWVSLTYSTFVFAYWQFLGDIYETNHELQMISPFTSYIILCFSHQVHVTNGKFSCYIFFIMNEKHEKFAKTNKQKKCKKSFDILSLNC